MQDSLTARCLVLCLWSFHERGVHMYVHGSALPDAGNSHVLALSFQIFPHHCISTTVRSLDDQSERWAFSVEPRTVPLYRSRCDYASAGSAYAG